MWRANPVELADWQLRRDRKATARFDGLFDRKIERMSVSPLAYLRGAAPLFYRLLARCPELAEGPGGKGWLCGDAHLENFGAYRSDAPARGREAAGVAFDINDFDEATIGPWRIDVLRLTTSLLLAGRELGVPGQRSIALSHILLESYVRHACHLRRLPEPPPPVAALLDRVKRRSHRVLLAERTETVAGQRRFTRGPRYVDLPKRLAGEAREAFARYAAPLAGAAQARDAFQILDVAFRVAGTGSLGSLRIAVLTRGRGGRDGAWLFDMKEERRPASAPWLLEPDLKPAKRVLTAMRATLERSPRMIGSTKIGGSSMFVRRFAPQDDKLRLERVRDQHLAGLAAHLGALLGRAHRRGAVKMPRGPWSKTDRFGVIERAIAIAAVHEGAYLAMGRAAGRS